MQKTQQNLIILNAVFVTCLIIANIVSCKVVVIGPLTIPAAIVAYPLTFLMTDVIGEIWGREQANRTVKLGFCMQILSLTLIFLATLLPVAPYADNQAEFQSILGSSFRVVFASMVSYACSQTWDVFMFHKIRDWYIAKHGTTKGGKWMWNNGSTMTSQIIDTAIFITIAFYGVVPNIFAMIASQYLIKFVYAACDTPFFYLLTREGKRHGKKENGASEEGNRQATV